VPSELEIASQLIDLVRTDLAVDAPHVDASSQLIGDLGLDSVAFAISLIAIEDRFGVRLTEKELFECKTIGDTASLICGHLAAPPAASTPEAVQHDG
jgi:acyl carrier protein